ncbi:MAG: hypothetical protein WBA25_17260 [Jannaschia sp.]
MKIFGHEVLIFKMDGAASKDLMADTLRERGACRFEVVGVVQMSDTTTITVFLIRETPAISSTKGKAA